MADMKKLVIAAFHDALSADADWSQRHIEQRDADLERIADELIERLTTTPFDVSRMMSLEEMGAYDAVIEARRALSAMYLMVPEAVALDVNRKVQAAFASLTREPLPAAATAGEAVAWGELLGALEDAKNACELACHNLTPEYERREADSAWRAAVQGLAMYVSKIVFAQKVAHPSAGAGVSDPELLEAARALITATVAEHSMKERALYDVVVARIESTRPASEGRADA